MKRIFFYFYLIYRRLVFWLKFPQLFFFLSNWIQLFSQNIFLNVLVKILIFSNVWKTVGKFKTCALDRLRKFFIKGFFNFWNFHLLNFAKTTTFINWILLNFTDDVFRLTNYTIFRDAKPLFPPRLILLKYFVCVQLEWKILFYQ
jgi:hypothetical protein